MSRPLTPALLALAALAAFTLPGLARAQVDVEIYDRTAGRTLPSHEADGQRWIAGEPRHEYGIRLRNRTGARVLAVVSVDGVNVVTGQSASPAQSGYVLAPWQETTIDGWRKSLDRVAAFYFTAVPDSYAARTGRPTDVGVIGVATFRERPAPPPVAPAVEAPPPAAPSESRARGATADESVAQRLGTGHGRRIESRAGWTDFVRASDDPDCVLALRYDSRRNLVARGVLPPEPPRHRHPDPFPAAFVPDPR